MKVSSALIIFVLTKNYHGEAYIYIMQMCKNLIPYDIIGILDMMLITIIMECNHHLKILMLSMIG
jgi:hypothetical protein